jgi:hypothetical protein
MLKLYEFQKSAAIKIHSRFTQYESDPLVLRGTSEGGKKHHSFKNLTLLRVLAKP